MLAGKAYDGDALHQIIARTGAEAVIPGNRSRKIPTPRAPIIYKMRNCRG